eukprot:767645-Hanusia_phi.AAC.2
MRSQRKRQERQEVRRRLVEPECLPAISCLSQLSEASSSSSSSAEDITLEVLQLELDAEVGSDSPGGRMEGSDKHFSLTLCSQESQALEQEKDAESVVASSSTRPSLLPPCLSDTGDLVLHGQRVSAEKTRKKTKRASKSSEPALRSIASQAERVGMLAAESMQECAERLPGWASGRRREKKARRRDFVSLRQSPEELTLDRVAGEASVGGQEGRAEGEGEDAEGWTDSSRPSFLDRYIQVTSLVLTFLVAPPLVRSLPHCSRHLRLSCCCALSDDMSQPSTKARTLFVIGSLIPIFLILNILLHFGSKVTTFADRARLMSR